MKQYLTTRRVTTDECPWLADIIKRDIEKGEVVYYFTKPTYGAVNEFPAALQEDYPFFELPWDSVEEIVVKEPVNAG